MVQWPPSRAQPIVPCGHCTLMQCRCRFHAQVIELDESDRDTVVGSRSRGGPSCNSRRTLCSGNVEEDFVTSLRRFLQSAHRSGEGHHRPCSSKFFHESCSFIHPGASSCRSPGCSNGSSYLLGVGWLFEASPECANQAVVSSRHRRREDRGTSQARALNAFEVPERSRQYTCR